MLKKSLASLQLEAAQSGKGTLKRSLGAINLVAIGVGVIIGAGLFFSLTGIAAAITPGQPLPCHSELPPSVVRHPHLCGDSGFVAA